MSFYDVMMCIKVRFSVGDYGKKIADVFFYICLLLFVVVIFRIISIASFRIPTDSMQPTLQPGDNILVNKNIMGARIFDIWEAAEEKEVEIYRLPGLGKVNAMMCWCFTIPIPTRTTASPCTC